MDGNQWFDVGPINTHHEMGRVDPIGDRRSIKNTSSLFSLWHSSLAT